MRQPPGNRGPCDARGVAGTLCAGVRPLREEQEPDHSVSSQLSGGVPWAEPCPRCGWFDPEGATSCENCGHARSTTLGRPLWPGARFRLLPPEPAATPAQRGNAVENLRALRPELELGFAPGDRLGRWLLAQEPLRAWIPLSGARAPRGRLLYALNLALLQGRIEGVRVLCEAPWCWPWEAAWKALGGAPKSLHVDVRERLGALPGDEHALVVDDWDLRGSLALSGALGRAFRHRVVLSAMPLRSRGVEVLELLSLLRGPLPWSAKEQPSRRVPWPLRGADAVELLRLLVAALPEGLRDVGNTPGEEAERRALESLSPSRWPLEKLPDAARLRLDDEVLARHDAEDLRWASALCAGRSSAEKNPGTGSAALLEALALLAERRAEPWWPGTLP